MQPDAATAQFLNKTFNMRVRTPQFDGPQVGVVVRSTSTTVTFSIPAVDFSGSTGYTAQYQPIPGATPATPPKGTVCCVAYVPNAGVDQRWWVIAFQGWPT